MGTSATGGTDAPPRVVGLMCGQDISDKSNQRQQMSVRGCSLAVVREGGSRYTTHHTDYDLNKVLVQCRVTKEMWCLSENYRDTREDRTKCWQGDSLSRSMQQTGFELAGDMMEVLGADKRRQGPFVQIWYVKTWWRSIQNVAEMFFSHAHDVPPSRPTTHRYSYFW